MSKFELFKKLNLVLRITGMNTNPTFMGLLNVAQASPADAYKSHFQESSSSPDDCLEVYPNPMAVRYLMGICEEVINSKTPNRKDEFQLVAIALKLAVKRISTAFDNNDASEFVDCNALLDFNPSRNGMCSAGGNEIRSTIESFNTDHDYTEVALSNALMDGGKSYVSKLDLNPIVCLLAPVIENSFLLRFIDKEVFGNDEPVPVADPRDAPTRRQANESEIAVRLSLLGLAHTVGGVSELKASVLAKSLNVEFETAINHWTDKGHHYVNPDWFNSVIAPVPNLVDTLLQLLGHDSFEYKTKSLGFNARLKALSDEELLDEGSIAHRPEQRKCWEDIDLEKSRNLASKQTSIIRKLLDNVQIRLMLVQYGLVVRNPLYDANDAILKYNPPVILSGFGVVVAKYAQGLDS